MGKDTPRGIRRPPKQPGLFDAPLNPPSLSAAVRGQIRPMLAALMRPSANPEGSGGVAAVREAGHE